jgi:hypothetical protein
MKKIGQSTSTGSDWTKLYDLGDEHIGVVEMRFWEDMDSSAVETYGKYNLMSGKVCLRGFESYSQGPDFIGQSVHDALRSCGYVMSKLTMGPGWVISNSYDGTELGRGIIADLRLILAECLWTYGARDIDCDVSGNNVRLLERRAQNAL